MVLLYHGVLLQTFPTFINGGKVKGQEVRQKPNQKDEMETLPIFLDNTL